MRDALFSLSLSGAIIATGTAACAAGLPFAVPLIAGLISATILTDGFGANSRGRIFKPGIFISGLVAGAGLILSVLAIDQNDQSSSSVKPDTLLSSTFTATVEEGNKPVQKHPHLALTFGEATDMIGQEKFIIDPIEVQGQRIWSSNVGVQNGWRHPKIAKPSLG